MIEQAIAGSDLSLGTKTRTAYGVCMVEEVESVADLRLLCQPGLS